MELVRLNVDNIWSVVHKRVTPDQQRMEFIKSNEDSIVEAFAARECGLVALPFGLYHKENPVGFVMIGYDKSGSRFDPKVARGNYRIWRLMIDERYQHHGLGTKAMEVTLEYIRSKPCGPGAYCWLTYSPNNIPATKLVEHFGFRNNGEIVNEDLVALLKL